MEETAQGALEYLLIIAGAILVAAVVIAILPGLISPTKHTAQNSLEHFLAHVS